MDQVVIRKSISAKLAQAMIDAAVAKAQSMTLAISVAIVDESGMLKAFHRMDGSVQVSVSAAQKKALTAVGFGVSTGADWYQFMKDDPILSGGAPQLENFILLGGGMPIRVDGELVGAIGVSGGHYAKDEECAKAALALVNDKG
jgi:uncharacterized protein GlcG (DUF336 family)